MTDKNIELPFFNVPTDALKSLRADIGQRNYEKILPIYIHFWGLGGNPIPLDYVVKNFKISEEKIRQIEQINPNFLQIITKNEQNCIKKYVNSEHILNYMSKLWAKYESRLKWNEKAKNKRKQEFTEKYGEKFK